MDLLWYFEAGTSGIQSFARRKGRKKKQQSLIGRKEKNVKNGGVRKRGRDGEQSKESRGFATKYKLVLVADVSHDRGSEQLSFAVGTLASKREVYLHYVCIYVWTALGFKLFQQSSSHVVTKALLRSGI